MKTAPKNRRGPPLGSRNAAKPEELKRTSKLVINVTPDEKAACVRQAHGKLNAWARRRLGIDET
jgi:hypothetical protein